MGLSPRDEYEYNQLGQLVKLHRTRSINVDLIYEYDEKGLITKSLIINDMRKDATNYE